jgi:alpha-D-ribose 1-methylphosphonate 5-triphosphate synthase subunit PhnI
VMTFCKGIAGSVKVRFGSRTDVPCPLETSAATLESRPSAYFREVPDADLLSSTC